MTLHQTQVLSPTPTSLSTLWTAKLIAQVVDMTHDDDDANSHMSDIPLLLPASANISSNNSAVVTFSQVGSDLLQNVHSLQPIQIQTRVNPWQLRYPVTYPKCVPAVPGPQEAVQSVTQRVREALYDQRETARRLWQEIATYTIITCRYKLGISNMKQMRDFLKDQGNCYRDFLRKQIKFLRISEKFW